MFSFSILHYVTVLNVYDFCALISILFVPLMLHPLQMVGSLVNWLNA